MLEIGSLIDGKYKILNQIGKGGMSVVYLAINEKANKTWAVKEVRKDGVQNYEVVRQGLIVETDLLKKLKHPNLPSIIDVIDEDDIFLIVMDYIEGNSLEALLKEEGAQSQEQVISWGKQLCDVLGYLHRQKPPIIYRDMKPSNVMLKSDGTVTLIDFGTAREFKERSSRDDTVCLGTPGYAAPEQWGGSGQTDARTDIYCLGATLYHLLTGHNPSEPPYEIYPIRQWNPALSSGLEAVILKCTQRDPGERYQSCEELYYALEHYGELDEKYRRQQKRRAGLFAAALSLSLIFGTTALAAGNMERGLTANTYQSLIADARSGATKEEQIRLCEQAVSLEPGRADGYLELLEHVFLTAENGAVSLDREEDEELRSLLGRTDAEGRTYESLLKENAEEYGRLAYELGLAYYYYYETEGNKTYAVKWLDAAAQSQTLPGKERVRAERLGTIAGYYTQIGLIDKAGDSTVSYLDYWNQLTELTAGNLVDEDNAMTALRMYQELAGQLYTRAPEFAAAGVSREQMKEQLAGIRKHLQTDFLEVDLKEQGLEEMEQSLEQLTAQAEEQVDAVFSQPQALAEHEGV